MLKVVIFDVDGVLVDSREANVALYQAILHKAGYNNVSRQAILECFHMPLWQSIEKLTGSQDQEEIRKIWESAHDPAIRDAFTGSP
jgi:phosphoglycolate phosphatase-like HAD superfamily hydrolase